MGKVEDNSIRKYSRRLALQKGIYGAKIAGSGFLGGVIGNIIGQVYETERNAIRNISNYFSEKEEKVSNAYKKQKEGARNIYDFFKEKIQGDNNKETPKKVKPQAEKKLTEKENLTRRGFLRGIARIIHEHPVGSGTTIGATYSGTKQAIKGYENYQNKLHRAQTRLDRAQAKLDRTETEKYRKEYQNQITELTREIRELKDILKSGRLEKTIEEESEQLGEKGDEFIVLGAITLIISIFLGNLNQTGFAISNNYYTTSILPILLFLTSLITLFIGVKKKR